MLVLPQRPPLIRRGQSTVLSVTGDNDLGGVNFNFRIRLTAASLPTVVGRKAARVRFSAGPSAGITISNASIGHYAGSGDAWDMANLTPLFFQDAGSNVIGAGGAIFSDWVPFVWNGSSDIIVAWFSTGSPQTAGFISDASRTFYYKASADESQTPNVTGYSSAASRGDGIPYIEFQGLA